MPDATLAQTRAERCDQIARQRHDQFLAAAGHRKKTKASAEVNSERAGGLASVNIPRFVD